MPYAVKSNGSYRAVTEDMELQEGETYYDEVPQWAVDMQLAIAVENTWRIEELKVIAEQLIALEDEDPAAMPGTDAEWRAYRTKVRNWKEGNVNFPTLEHRPVRPE